MAESLLIFAQIGVLASTEERESILKGINASILLDISRSLAVIADALRKDEVTP